MLSWFKYKITEKNHARQRWLFLYEPKLLWNASSNGIHNQIYVKAIMDDVIPGRDATIILYSNVH